MSPSAAELPARPVTLDANPASVGKARSSVTDQLDGLLSDEHLQAARLMVTELVTNSVRHAGPGKVTVAVRLDDDHVRVEVHDNGPGFSGPRTPDPINGGGYGLVLVEQLASDWGICRNGTTAVWFSLPRS